MTTFIGPLPPPREIERTINENLRVHDGTARHEIGFRATVVGLVHGHRKAFALSPLFETRAEAQAWTPPEWDVQPGHAPLWKGRRIDAMTREDLEADLGDAVWLLCLERQDHVPWAVRARYQRDAETAGRAA